MAVLSSRAQERRSHEKLLPLQSPRAFSALARLYYLVRPTKTAMLRRLIIYMKIEFSSQRREMLLFLTTNMAAVTSRATPSVTFLDAIWHFAQTN